VKSKLYEDPEYTIFSSSLLGPNISLSTAPNCFNLWCSLRV